MGFVSKIHNFENFQKYPNFKKGPLPLSFGWKQSFSFINNFELLKFFKNTFIGKWFFFSL